MIAGRVSDMLGGFMGVEVSVNGKPANVIIGVGTNGTFERGSIELAMGDNTIFVSASDALGNSTTKRITYSRIAAEGPKMTVVSGNLQTGQVQGTLPQPIVVKVTDADGSAFANKLVNFDVVRSDGRLAIRPKWSPLAFWV